MTYFLSTPGLYSHLQENMIREARVLSSSSMLTLPMCFDSLFSFPFGINYWGIKQNNKNMLIEYLKR